MEEGWVSLHRKIINHWIWENPIKFQWWVRMIFEANHSDSKFLLGNQIIIVKRGQSSNSLSTWATKFGVGKKAVSSFFTLLENDKMIDRKTIGKGKHSTTLITIRNYEVLQGGEETLGQHKGNARETQGKRKGHTNNNVNNVNNVNKKEKVKKENFYSADSLFSIFDLKIKYLEDKNVVNAVVKNRDNKFKSVEHLKTQLDNFVNELHQRRDLTKTESDFATHFRRWHKKKHSGQEMVRSANSIIPIK